MRLVSGVIRRERLLSQLAVNDARVAQQAAESSAASASQQCEDLKRKLVDVRARRRTVVAFAGVSMVAVAVGEEGHGGCTSKPW